MLKTRIIFLAFLAVLSGNAYAFNPDVTITVTQPRDLTNNLAFANFTQTGNPTLPFATLQPGTQARITVVIPPGVASTSISLQSNNWNIGGPTPADKPRYTSYPQNGSFNPNTLKTFNQFGTVDILYSGWATYNIRYAHFVIDVPLTSPPFTIDQLAIVNYISDEYTYDCWQTDYTYYLQYGYDPDTCSWGNNWWQWNNGGYGIGNYGYYTQTQNISAGGGAPLFSGIYIPPPAAVPPGQNPPPSPNTPPPGGNTNFNSSFNGNSVSGQACPYETASYVDSISQGLILSYPPSLMSGGGCGLTSLLNSSNPFGSLGNVLGSFGGNLNNIFSKGSCQFIQNTFNQGNTNFQMPNIGTSINVNSNSTSSDFYLP